MKLSPTQLRVLRAVKNGDITWQWAGTRTFLRWWLTEDDYRILTKAERQSLERLAEEGVIKKRYGWHSGIGGFVVTPKGQALLDEERA